MSALDPARYVEDVVRPVQRGWSPSRNLFRVYGLDPDAVQSDVDEAVATVPRQWGLPEIRVHTRGCERLRAARSGAEEVLRDPGRRETHRAEIEKDLGVLAELLRHRLHGAPAIPPTAVTALIAETGHRWARPDVPTALGMIGADERDWAALTPIGVPKRWRQVGECLVDLPYANLWDYLTGAPGLAGVDTSVPEIDARRKRLRVARDRAATAESTLLALIRHWLAEPGGLPDVVRHELVTEAHGRRPLGYAAVRAVVADLDRCAAAGLVADPDALAYAAWWTPDAQPRWVDEYTAAIASGELRAALDILDLHPLPADWLPIRDELRARVAEADRPMLVDTAEHRPDLDDLDPDHLDPDDLDPDHLDDVPPLGASSRPDDEQAERSDPVGSTDQGESTDRGEGFAPVESAGPGAGTGPVDVRTAELARVDVPLVAVAGLRSEDSVHFGGWPFGKGPGPADAEAEVLPVPWQVESPRPTTVAMPVPSITGFSATPVGARMRLQWDWPPGVTHARVVWRVGTPPTGPADSRAYCLDITRDGYLAEPVEVRQHGLDEHWFGVCPCLDGRYGPLATVRARPTPEVSYSIRPTRWFESGTHVVSAHGPGGLPAIVVIAKPGSAPRSVRDGLELARLAPNTTQQITIPRRMARPVHLRAFPLDDRVRLRHPGQAELVVRKVH
ncbi:hypothetical protein [Actinokineospora enzanensis]|uniref:hypothetical protein n=1 Tax=Actinokineospora enzanensis TaxID=155975 RepID=UPI00035D3FA1|nr:hypothetical protein [Actinokineospora enzanensis]